MNLFHRHHWDEVRRVYTPPARRGGTNLSGELAQQMAFGITTVELRCTGCGDVRARVLLGDVTGATNERTGA